jgi:hypothetical protein
MNTSYDYFGRVECPYIVLCNPDQTTQLYALDMLAFDTDLKKRFNALSEFSFSFPKSIDGGVTTLDAYEYLMNKRLILIEGHGYFQIIDVEESLDGSVPIKNIKCQSLESELINKKVVAYGGTKKLWDILDSDGTILKDMITLCPTWSVGTISAELLIKYRTFDISDSNIYNFLMENVAKAFDCIFEFNTVTKTINVKTVADATTTSDIFLSFDNVIENASFAEKSDEIVSALSVYGGNDLSIRLVNPLGTSTIYNFDYYANLNWMSQGLIDAITAWKALLITKESDYGDLLTILRTYIGEKIVLEGELSDLNSAYDALEIVQATRIQGGLDYSDINSQLVAKQAEIDAKNLQITNKQTQIDSTTTSLETIQSEVSFEVNFTSPQLLELENFIIENTYQNSNIITTDSMTAVEEQDASQSLYDQAQDVLSKVSAPRYELSLDAVNFSALSEFDAFTDQLDLGCIVTAELKDNSTIETVLLELQFSFDDPTDFKMTFSNRLRLDGDNYKYSDLMGTVVETGSQLSFNSEKWSSWNDDYKDEVSTFITSALDATVNNLISNSNREITIDQTGLRGRASDGVGGYESNQVWLTNNVLAFSNDGFESAKLALGQIPLPEGGTAYGLVADVIVGRILAGNQLTITNEGSNFTLDSLGARLSNASFTLENTKSKITLDPTDGIKIQKKVSGSSTPVSSGTSSNSSGTSVSTLSWSHTVLSNVDRLLIVTISSYKSAGTPSTTSVSFGSESLLKLTESASGNQLSEIWYLKSPTTITANISINCQSETYIVAGATNYYNVDQITTFQTPVSANGSYPTNPSVAVTSAVGNLVIDSLSYGIDADSTVGAGQTQIYNAHATSIRGSASRESGASLVTMSWTLDSDANWILIGVSLIKSTSYTLSDMLYLDVNGNAIFAGQLSAATGTFSGDISAASGTFSGAINAQEGNIGTLIIDSNGLSDGSGNYLKGNGDLNWGPLNITGSTGTFSGNFYAANMLDQVQDSQIANLSADKITAGTISAITISGSTINGGTINGTTINWTGVSMYSPGSGWSRIEFGKLELVEDGLATSLTMDGGFVTIYGDTITLAGVDGTLEIDGLFLYSNVSGDGGFGYSDKIAISTPSGTRYLWFDNGILTNFTTT